MNHLSGLAPRAGIGFKPEHFPPLQWHGQGSLPFFLEIHPQNYFHDGGPALAMVQALACDWPISAHSVGLSIGSADGPDEDELAQLAAFLERVPAAIVSEHLSWSHLGAEKFPDLLPLPLTEAVLEHVAAGVARVQDYLQRPILIENPSRMLAFSNDTMTEAVFLNRLARSTGCGLLLDINNIVVSATNLGLDPVAMLDAVEPAHVAEIHLAGHAMEYHEDGPLLIDDHGSAVSAQTWTLFERFVTLAGPRPTLIEWDNNIPPFHILLGEAAKADAVLTSFGPDAAAQTAETAHALA